MDVSRCCPPREPVDLKILCDCVYTPSSKTCSLSKTTRGGGKHLANTFEEFTWQILQLPLSRLHSAAIMASLISCGISSPSSSGTDCFLCHCLLCVKLLEDRSGSDSAKDILLWVVCNPSLWGVHYFSSNSFLSVHREIWCQEIQETTYNVICLDPRVIKKVWKQFVFYLQHEQK